MTALPFVLAQLLLFVDFLVWLYRGMPLFALCWLAAMGLCWWVYRRLQP